MSQGLFPGDPPNDHGKKGGDPQISPADAEHNNQPALETGDTEKQIAECGSLGAKRPQKIIPHSENRPHGKADQKPPGSKNRYGHPSRRRQLKPCRGSS